MRIYICDNCEACRQCGDEESLEGLDCVTCGRGVYGYLKSIANKQSSAAMPKSAAQDKEGANKRDKDNAFHSGCTKNAAETQPLFFGASKVDVTGHASIGGQAPFKMPEDGEKVEQATEVRSISITREAARKKLESLFLKGKMSDIISDDAWMPCLEALGISYDEISGERLYDLFYNKVATLRSVILWKPNGAIETIAADAENFLNKLLERKIKPDVLRRLDQENAIKAVIGAGDSYKSSQEELSGRFLKSRKKCVWFDSEWEMYDFGNSISFADSLCAPLHAKSLEAKLEFCSFHGAAFGLEESYADVSGVDDQTLEALGSIVGLSDRDGAACFCKLVDIYQRRFGRFPTVSFICVAGNHEAILGRLEDLLKKENLLSSAENKEKNWLNFLYQAGLINGQLSGVQNERANKNSFNYGGDIYTPLKLTARLERTSIENAVRISDSLMSSQDFLEWLEKRGANPKEVIAGADKVIADICAGIENVLTKM